MNPAVIPRHADGPAAPGHWLTAGRVRLYARALLIAHVVTAVLYVLADLSGRFPLIGNDFRVFWSASQLALDGMGADAYRIGELFAVQQTVTPELGSPKAWQHWFYPPTTLLFVAPLALLPYYLSFLLFTAAGMAFYLYVLRAITPRKDVLVLALAFPAVLFAAVNGQNSFFTAACAGLALVLLDRRPALAGVMIGLLGIKPQLAVLFVLALASAKRWEVLCYAAGTALALLLASLAIFSPQSGAAFLDNLALAKSFAESRLLPLEKMPTVFASARLAGLGPALAHGLHLAVALAGAACVVLIWARDSAPYLRNSALVLGTLLASPHLFEYDLVWLAWPIAWLALNGLEHGWHKGEREMLVLTWLSPLLGEMLAYVIPVQAAPMLCLGWLVLLLRRTRRAAPVPSVSLLAEEANHVA